MAIAECFRGDGEILANPIGDLPMIGGRLARASFEPDLVMTDGYALLIAGPQPVGETDVPKTIEAWNPYRSMFDIVWSGRRHVMMGATQIDRFGNQNFAFLGEWDQAQDAAARLPRRAGQHDPQHHELLGAGALDPGVRGEGLGRDRRRQRPRRRAR